MKSLSIHPKTLQPSTQVYIDSNLLDSDFLKNTKKRPVVVTTHPLEALGNRLGCFCIVVPNEKSSKTYEMILQNLLKNGYGRDTLIIALGGGTLLDVTSFVASTYMRGVELILIPTTLLSMVDASIGGKTAIDTPFGKNLIGSFYFPSKILIDITLLKTLPEEEKINGLFEILKMGLVKDSSILDLYANQNITEELLVKAIQAKIDVVEKDPFEKGLRRVLNFGHTIGHGLELIGSGISHGRAIALGCIAEAHLSMQLGYLSKEVFEEIQNLYRQFPLELPPGYTRSELLKNMELDKKKKGRNLRFVLIDRIGHALEFDGEYCFCPKEKDLEATLDFLEKYYERSLHCAL